MQEAISKAATLVEAHAYIREFRGKVVVVKVGGSIMDQPEALGNLLGDVSFMHAVGMRPVVVHGGGKAINAAMSDAGLDAQFVQGRRYTDERTLAIAEHVLINDINAAAVGHLKEAGTPAMGLHSLGSCVVFAKRLTLRGEQNRRIDIGMVGEVEWVNTELLRAVLDAGSIPVIAPIARDPAGGKLNINADSVAGHVAGALRAEKFVLVSDTHGIRTDPDSEETASTLTRDATDGLIRDGVIDGGMLPKVEAALTALGGGCRKAHIVDGRIPHALLLEVYTEAGIGTEIVL
ncbi:acetylglutamate kinase [Phycisphaera mikurensis]|uniref:Acetylglutamate kinase n=1 Tax=Phycisphaera mikurensis (strain NBRC 102666 / KCTC 22515 / FYK2301M01) TaxID=1142394 RepID=I0IEE3_PHYMF|nr:acetylglutamate kinase [Phycisphaera mikurensis]MBB6441431.1 acetylglutamate kinase [Phycisphaera mikurensis]BAM03631.1 acetylglutamate kinase [Phycisphaera mikurensis NBRC 102666]